MHPAERERFDRLLEDVLETLPQRLHDLMEEAPLIVDDRPSAELLRELGMDDSEDVLCGLHSGLALTEKSVAGPDHPTYIHIFREGILDQAGGWEPDEDENGPFGGEDAVREEIRITLLHEIGHHFGLSEEDLTSLGYD